MSIDLILVIVAIAIGLAYFTVRNNRKQRELRTQVNRGMK